MNDSTRRCTVSDCEGKHKAHGLCAHHYQRLRKGVPLDKPNPKAMTTEERFWSKVDRGSPEECWEWNGPRHRQGYGHFWLDDSNVLAHRVSVELAHGTVPSGQLVLHTCDNPPCVNPSHLYVGDQADNMQDRSDRGRDNRANQVRGVRCTQSRLNPAKVRAIRRLKAEGWTFDALAEKFGVHRMTVAGVVWGRTWKHVE